MSGAVSVLSRIPTVSGRFVKVLYLDLNTNYTQDNQQILLENLAAVNNELLNLIMTVPGELAFEPDFGCQIPNLLFEPPGRVTSWMISNYLFVAVERWLPYITIDFSNSIIQPISESLGQYYFRLVYSVVGITSGQVDFHFQT